ncbi:hypothetical protein BOTBODRAFT_113976 [Botryobasidium botryosum FD-172 SS1]|uniref:GST N-terminal domain-containing protein n=1 Tax=Botryobasidium botryosum (strain FD-172 SS1) TaxID=930990 RepID=A0A067MAF6_BOTB1|nr:hypothetical protein BOTBODRAFT_113976 [Botryobasidium botryosum FD-172 SS1]
MAASGSNPVILYDIKSALEPAAWSPSTWKVRFVLNYKRIPYKTVWVSFPDIASTLSSLGLKPLGSDVSYTPYTLPVIADPTSAGPPIIVRDSTAIAEYLETTYPDPERSLFPGGTHALQALFSNYVSTRLTPPIGSLVVALIPAILDEAGSTYYNETRKARLGNSLAELRPKGAELEAAWSEAKKEFDVLDSLLRSNQVESGGVGGDLVLGNQFSYADFVLVSNFVFLSKLQSDEDGNPWERIRAWNDGRWDRMWKRCEELMQVK